VRQGKLGLSVLKSPLRRLIQGARINGRGAELRIQQIEINVNSILRFLRDEDGPTAVEYAIMLGLILAVVISSVTFLGNETGRSFDKSLNDINAHTGQSGGGGS